MRPDASFELDPRLERDTLFICELALSRVLLMNDRRYPWLILVPRVRGITELTDLEDAVQADLCRESLRVCAILKQEYPQRKLNTGVLGNVVPQLHLHHVMRETGDPAWPGPVWGHAPAESYTLEAARRMLERLRVLFDR